MKKENLDWNFYIFKCLEIIFNMMIYVENECVSIFFKMIYYDFLVVCIILSFLLKFLYRL